MEADEEAVAMMKIGIAHAVIGILLMTMPTELLVETTIVEVAALAPVPDHRLAMTDTTAQEVGPVLVMMRDLGIEVPAVIAIVAENEPQVLPRSRQHRNRLKMNVTVVQSSCSNLRPD